jgi:hypothetical protein
VELSHALKAHSEPRAVQTADVTVTPEGLVYVTDYDAGLHVAAFTG